jgi:hypothetical protein
MEEERTMARRARLLAQSRQLTYPLLVFLIVVTLAICFTGVASSQGPARKAEVVNSCPVPAPSAMSFPSHPEAIQEAIDLAHAACFGDDPFPSAKKCQKCHEGQFREWSVSPHAYAQLSPVFNAMSNSTIKLTNGTNGDFCIRCHTPAGMSQSEPINMSQMDRPPSSREGVTCTVCHRINQPWGKISARQHIVPGDLYQPVYGPEGNAKLEEVLANPDKYGALKTSNEDPSRRANAVHRESIPFFQLRVPGFCGSCHDVFAPNGFRLEDAFSEFKTSPAARCKKQSCQDCHMGVVPGVAAGYATAPAARVGNASTPPRRRTNHMFVGPDYSIIHPGLYPHHPRAIREEKGPAEDGLATMREWLLFDPHSGWGTDEFEANVPKDTVFPAAWADATRRRQGRDILNEQYQLLAEATAARHQLLSTGYQLSDIMVEHADSKGLRFKVKVFNGTDGHGVPTGFDAERLVFVRVTVTNSAGQVVYKSGDLDPNGDVRNEHSVYVHNGLLPLDKHLFSLQTKFIVRNIRGSEREQVLVVPYGLDPLPFIRPETRPYTVLGRPVAARKHKQNLEANGGYRWAEYEVKRRELCGPGPYSVQVQLISGMVPVNLVNDIQTVGFDYGMSPRQVADNIVAGHLVLHERQTVIDVP